MKTYSLNRGFLFQHIDAINVCICYFLIYVAVAEFLDLFENALMTVRKVAIVFYFLFFFNAIPALLRRLKEKKWPFYMFVLTYSFSYFISYSVTTDLKLHGLVIMELIRYCLCMFLLGSSVIDAKDLMYKLRISGIVVLILYFLQFFVFSSLVEYFSYSQNMGYNSLLCLSVFYLLYLLERKKVYLLITGISFIFIVMSGSRGPLLCGALICLMGYVVLKGVSVSKLMPFVIAFVFLLIFYFTFEKEILGWLFNTLNDNGLSVRIVEKLMDNSIGDDSERDIYHKLAWDYINDHLFYGSGVANDRIYLYQYVKYFEYSQTVYGSYCHNIALELLMQYGLFAGVIILLISIIYVIRFSLRVKCLYSKSLLLVALSIGFFPLMVSRSYFTFSPFYFLLGLLLNRSLQFRKNKYEKSVA